MKVQQAVQVLAQGGLLLHATESVFGLACDPLNREALLSLRNLKQREQAKGFILLCSDLEQVARHFPQLQLTQQHYRLVELHQDIPTTWLFPANEGLDELLVGKNKNLAVRVSKHAQSRMLCQGLQSPIVTTSANFSGQAPVRSLLQARKLFGQDVDFYLPGILNKSLKGKKLGPSQIIDAESGKLLRAAS